VTGLSGSGKSTATRAFEDLGYFCVDNLPPVLLPRIVELVTEARGGGAKVALVADVRGKEFLPDLARVTARLRREGHVLQTLFLDASDEAILRRFSETRRRHPLAGRGGALEAIRRERELLAPLREGADAVLDTSGYTVHSLREKILQMFGDRAAEGMQFSIVSFGFKNGLPPEADMVVDARFLPNPHFVADLKPLTGLDRPVRDFVLRKKVTRDFLARLTDFLNFLLPLYRKEGKAYFTLAVGCTGGRHRSVALAEALAASFAGEKPSVTHRDATREGRPARREA
jgi:UPF0042 nucleotide-binding protein